MTEWQNFKKALLAFLNSETTAYVWAWVLLGFAGAVGAGVGGWAGLVLFAVAFCVAVGWGMKAN
jgi:hypothetical protein